MGKAINLTVLFLLFTIALNVQSREATTSDGKNVFLNPDSTWKYADELKDTTITDSRAETENGNGLSFSVTGRYFKKLPAPEYDSRAEGKVVVEISVDRSGKVTQAVPGIKGSTTLDEYLLKVSKEAAMNATLDPKPDAPLFQKGTITYNFRLK